MNPQFFNRLDWVVLGGAFAIWAAHFMLAWSISSIFPGQGIVLWLVAALTLASFGALAALWRWRKVEGAASVAGLAIVLAAAGVVYDFLPALMA
ncbi:hypothetical protein GRI72_01325 [Altererythrobacter marinus]|uniref:Uncharacterized protein n=1 Tax=Pelagerythrobacter marinus TaxID=538382 RepID=A0ABW9UVX0_9SPHN|nr:hypothetical protein [Pelagerythrobacter marinus]MXO67472.1 hypothetical protein [Pelagerythrobacter marinus]